LAINFEPQTLDGQSKALKTRSLVSAKYLSKKLALGIGTQGLVALSENA